MGEVVQRLRALVPVISEICQLSGTPGASIGVVHDNTVVFTHNHGYRDVKARLAPDENTIYYLGSLTKSFTAAGLGILVEEKKLSWDSKVKDVLPEFRQSNKTIEDHASVADFLSVASRYTTLFINYTTFFLNYTTLLRLQDCNSKNRENAFRISHPNSL